MNEEKYSIDQVALMYIDAQSKLNNQIKLNWEIQLKNEELIEENKRLVEYNHLLKEREARFKIIKEQCISDLRRLSKINS